MTIGSFQSQSQSISTGLISEWSGSITNIPEGYALCDGNNGTPNLTGKFIRGHQTSTGTPTTTGGNDALILTEEQLPAHSHDGTTDTAGGSHTHDLYAESIFDTYPNGYSDRLDSGTPSNSGGGHTHPVSTDSVGAGSSIENRPPYYERAYIMKL